MVTRRGNRKPANPTLAAADPQWHGAFDAISDALCLVDPKGTIRRCNQAFARFVGRPPEAVVGEDCCVLIHGGSDHPPGCPLPVALKSKDYQEGECLVGGRSVRVAVHPGLDESGALNGVVRIVLDVTERRRAEEAVRESEERFRHALDAIPDPIFVKDDQHRWTILNDAYCRLMGYEREQLIGKSDFDFFPHEEAEVFWAKDDEVFASGEENVSEEYFTSSSGTRHAISTKKSVYRDSRSGKQILVGVIRDVTEARRVSEELHRDREHLEDIVRERTKELVAANERLMREAEEHARAEELRTAIYEISEAANQFGSLEKLFISIHSIVGRLMNAKNFYIALHDPATNLISFPYFVDERDSTPPPFPLGPGMTSYVIRSGKPLLGTPGVLGDLQKRGEAVRLGADSIDWLGVPLKVQGRVIGVLAVQSYVGDVRYSEADRDVLSYVSAQVAQAIERKRAENELRSSEARFRSYFELPLIGMAISSKEKRWLQVNDRLCSILGFSRDELLTMSWAEITHPEDLEMNVRYFDRLLFGQIDHYDIEKRFVRRDGQVIWTTLSVGCVRKPDGDVDYLVVLVEDISERKVAEEALERSRAQLLQSQKMEVVGSLAGGVAHDFNNLLQAMLSHAQLLRHQAGNPEKVQAVVRELEQQINRGASLTRQLLLFSRRDTVKLERLDINDAVRDATQILQRVVRANIALAIEMAPEALPVEADRGQLQQVLMNLTLNASDAMPEGGRLVIRTGAGDGDEVFLSVADTGHGIPDAIRERIFEPFFTTKEPGRGTGLGLAVVHGIVTGHGGRIRVQSAVGSGSTITIVLPRAASGEVAAGKPIPRPTTEIATGNGERILVIEDEDGAREGLRDILISLGYDVAAVVSGEEASQLPEDRPFDLLLTDLMLPGALGPQVSRELQARWPALKVVMMSGYNEDEAVRRGVTAGNVRFLQKPFDMEALAREVRTVLDDA